MADTQKSIQSELESNASELSLSCVLSPFEDGDILSDTDSGDTETEDTVNSMGMTQVQTNTYQFEPHRTDDGEIENTSLNRLNDTSWQFLCIYSEINKYIYVFCVLKTGVEWCHVYPVLIPDPMEHVPLRQYFSSRPYFSFKQYIPMLYIIYNNIL